MCGHILSQHHRRPFVSLCDILSSIYNWAKEGRVHNNMNIYTLSHVSTPLWVLHYFSFALSSLWSLQFFEFVIPPFCISEKLTNIHIQMLSLLMSIYPIILVIITCILMELHVHARNYRIIQTMWKPFSIIIKKKPTLQQWLGMQ